MHGTVEKTAVSMLVKKCQILKVRGFSRRMRRHQHENKKIKKTVLYHGNKLLNKICLTIAMKLWFMITVIISIQKMQ